MLRERRLSFLAVVAAVALTPAFGCGKGWGGHCAADDDCFFTAAEWDVIRSMSNISRTPPVPDDSNELLSPDTWDTVAAATDASDLPPIVRLGWRLYHDPRFSGDGLTPKDTVGRATISPRMIKADAPQLGISCVDCHDPARHGGDFTSLPPNVSNGAGYYDVNGQQTLNVSRFFPVYYWNGRADSLWSQAAQVMESPVSMHGRREKTLWTVASCYLQDPDFVVTVGKLPLGAEIAAAAPSFTVATPATAKTDDFKNAFAQTVKDHPEIASTLAERTHVTIAKAIGAYEWFLTSDGSRFDQYADAGPASTLLTPSEKRGLKLFIGHAGCVNCHNTSLFSDRQFHNIGIGQGGDHVPTVAVCATTDCDCRVAAPAGSDGGVTATGTVGGKCLPAGAYAGVQKLHADRTTDTASTTVFRRCADDRYGCADETPATSYDATDGNKPPARWLGAWRTPSLRDVAMTGPYMHDGTLATLSDVVWHYDQGAVEGDSLGSSELAPLYLSAEDRADLVAFLGTLTGQSGPPALVAKPDRSCYPADCSGGGALNCKPAPSADGGADGP